MKGQGRGWITAEYNMLARQHQSEKTRAIATASSTVERVKSNGLSAAACAPLSIWRPGRASITVDCDVLEADGGTRTASHHGGLYRPGRCPAHAARQIDPARPVLTDSVAAVSVGMVEGRALLDLDYVEDVDAEVDMNVVMTGGGRFVELQGTGEEATFSEKELATLVKLARTASASYTDSQRGHSASNGRWHDKQHIHRFRR